VSFVITLKVHLGHFWVVQETGVEFFFGFTLLCREKCGGNFLRFLFAIEFFIEVRSLGGRGSRGFPGIICSLVLALADRVGKPYNVACSLCDPENTEGLESSLPEL
jgi:hypothetical protein